MEARTPAEEGAAERAGAMAAEEAAGAPPWAPPQPNASLRPLRLSAPAGVL
jgi:hypothetical protein